MRTFDLTPLLRSSVGFDNLARLTESLSRFDANETAYPPYNIEKLSDDDYRITMALAGFTAEELDVTVQENTLTISGRSTEDKEERTFLHRGIAKRAFERTFQLADTIKVTDAAFENGVLTISLVREIPEHKKPRQVAIANKSGEAKTIEQAAA